MENILSGIPCSPGIAIGDALVIQPELVVLPSKKIESHEIPLEISRYETAITELMEDFFLIIDKMGKESKNISAIIETHILMLKDPFLNDEIIKRISAGYSAESAVIQEFDHQKQFFKLSNDKLLREKAIDLDHIQERLIVALRSKCFNYSIAKDAVVVAQTLTPTDIVKFREAGIAGIITEVGGIASHSSILARSFEIPAIIGIKEALKFFNDGARVIVDGHTGKAVCCPTKSTLGFYKNKKRKVDTYKKQLGKLIKLPSETVDGRKIHLFSNQGLC